MSLIAAKTGRFDRGTVGRRRIHSALRSRSSTIGAGWRWPALARPATPPGSPPRAHAETTSDTTAASGGSRAPGRRCWSSATPPARSSRDIAAAALAWNRAASAANCLLPCGVTVVPAQAASTISSRSTVTNPPGADGPRPNTRLRRAAAPPVRDLCDVGDDPVAVLAARGQRRQDQEGRLLHRPLRHIRVYTGKLSMAASELGLPLHLLAG